MWHGGHRAGGLGHQEGRLWAPWRCFCSFRECCATCMHDLLFGGVYHLVQAKKEFLLVLYGMT
jgi:hypothetical protein